MGLMKDFKDWVNGGVDEDDEYDLEQEEVSAAAMPSQPSYNTASMAQTAQAPAAAPVRAAANQVGYINATTKLAVVLVKADQFNNVADIADHLKENRTVVLNLEKTDKEVSKRMLDFLSGVTYAKEGKIKRVSSDTYLITPLDVEIVGDDIISELENNGMRF